ncbi:MAG: capsule assembly Wzi family protein [Geobacter sp.]|nr:capsule assembly Wzi family protein [Geobacter sp.]
MRFILIIASFLSLLVSLPPSAHALLSSANVPLDSPAYNYLDKLAGMGLLESDIKGLKPFSKAEVARLTQEAERNLAGSNVKDNAFANELLKRLKELYPRELQLYSAPNKARLFDITPVTSGRLRYAWLDGTPRDYNRTVHDPGHQSAFGFIGGDLRPFSGTSKTSGSEGTPLLENNEGVVYRRGNSGELRLSGEGYIAQYATVAIEPIILATGDKADVTLQKAYLKIGGGGTELEIGRDANWFGPGYRGTTILTNNARNFDQIKLSSPEPLDVAWIKKYIGDVKYSLLLSRFDETGSGKTLRHPYLLGAKLAVKPKAWYEIGLNFVRQFGGPGFSGNPSLAESIFGGGDNDHANTIAGIDMRFRIPALRNMEFYGEFSGEDNAGGIWPIVESYVAGIYLPCITSSCRDDLRFEFFWGSEMLYGDWQFPNGYVYHGLTPGHSQGTAAQDYFVRYGHWFNPRSNISAEYSYTERGQIGRMPGQSLEHKHAGRISWKTPLNRVLDAELRYGIEKIINPNLQQAPDRTNQLFLMDLSYLY